MGASGSSRIGIVLPNGPEMAVAFLAVSSCAISAPLNPAYRENEFDFYLSDLKATALIVPAGSDSPAVEAAASRGIPILELISAPDAPAGCFSLSEQSLDGAENLRLDVRRRYRADSAYFRHNVPPQNGPAHASESLFVRAQYRPMVCTCRIGLLPQYHAAISYPRPHRRRIVVPVGGCKRDLHTGTRCHTIL